MNDHRGLVRFESFRFDRRRRGPVQQLIPQFGQSFVYQSENAAKIFQPLAFAVRRVLQPLADGRAEGLICFSFDGCRYYAVIVSQQRKKICLTWARTSRKIDLVLGQSEKKLHAAFKQAGNFRRQTVCAFPGVR